MFEEAREFMQRFMPHNLRKLKFYDDDVPLFTRYQIESQIESAYSHKVHAALRRQHRDRPHRGAGLHRHQLGARHPRRRHRDHRLNTNLEAADEIARQLRMRDVGGLIVIDFIDMESQKNQREVEDRLRDAVKQDRARIQIGKISRFGLLEMSRQRLRPSLSESTNIVCPRCNGMGKIRSVESLALAVLRLIGEEARKDRTAKVIAQLPVDVATYLMNEKRESCADIERRGRIDIILVPNRYLETPEYEIRRVRDDEAGLPENSMISHQMAVEPKIDLDAIATAEEEKAPVLQQPAVTTIIPSTPAPPAAPEVVAPAPVAVAAAPVVAAPVFGPRDNVLVRAWRWLAGDKRAPEPQPEAARGAPRKEVDRGFDRPRRDRDDRGRGGRGDRDRDSRRDGRDGRGRSEGRGERGSRDEARRENRPEGAQVQPVRGNEPRRDEPSRSQQPPRRDEGTRGGRRDGGQGGEGGPREGQSRRDGGQQGQRQPQQARPPREPREPREPRPPRDHREPQETREQVAAVPAVIAAVASDMNVVDATAAAPQMGDGQQQRPEGERSERTGRRSRRGGRRRRGRGDGGGEGYGAGAAAGAASAEGEGSFDQGPGGDFGDDAGGSDASGSAPAPQSFDAPREFVPAPPVDAPPAVHEAPRDPEPRSFDFDRPAAPPPPPPAPPREVAPAPCTGRRA